MRADTQTYKHCQLHTPRSVSTSTPTVSAYTTLSTQTYNTVGAHREFTFGRHKYLTIPVVNVLVSVVRKAWLYGEIFILVLKIALIFVFTCNAEFATC